MKTPKPTKHQKQLRRQAARKPTPHPERAYLVTTWPDEGKSGGASWPGGAALHFARAAGNTENTAGDGPFGDVPFGEPFAVRTDRELGLDIDSDHPHAHLARTQPAEAWAQAQHYRTSEGWVWREAECAAGHVQHLFQYTEVMDVEAAVAAGWGVRPAVEFCALVTRFAEGQLPELIVTRFEHGDPVESHDVPLAPILLGEGLLEWVPGDAAESANAEPADAQPADVDRVLEGVGVETVVLQLAGEILAANGYRLEGEWQEYDGAHLANIVPEAGA